MTTDKMPELLPCPFCGSDAGIYNNKPRIYCTNPLCVLAPGIDYGSLKEAAYGWNTRTIPTPTGKRKEALEAIDRINSERHWGNQVAEIFDEYEDTIREALSAQGVEVVTVRDSMLEKAREAIRCALLSEDKEFMQGMMMTALDSMGQFRKDLPPEQRGVEEMTVYDACSFLWGDAGSTPGEKPRDESRAPVWTELEYALVKLAAKYPHGLKIVADDGGIK